MRYFQYYIREADKPKAIPSFMSCIVDVRKNPECRRVNSSDREPFNWLPKLSYFENDFFLVASDLLNLANYSKGIIRSFIVLLFSLISDLISFPSRRGGSSITVFP